ncbi:probable G-protein coupled receptor Mth-like 1 [Lingula anatina]|uniref:Probable G-protein coupled receptor Mth-like 1 n=1 Tax=Lingula anatina TaxID=7574 RepID=A0A1S3H2R0_LINAN|nr:probable G-protein coupled receptor Mth-like 1 [Lingula anatina]XP_013380424.1 probable G-protein coupled receptor Mth-like 1 [Lingula anatina]|eukprot:XP_013380415.1 probable G-protein coupled receptor Mth-like 1 [Lingula anatina]
MNKMSLNLSEYGGHGDMLTGDNITNDSSPSPVRAWDIPWDSPAGIALIVALSISVCCLMVRIILQPFVKVYHTLPGKIHFCLVVAQCLVKVTFSMRPLFLGNPVHCMIFGNVVMWEFLSTFFWMNGLALHTFKTFGPNAPTSKATKRQECRRLGFIFAYATLSPTVIMSLVILMENLDIDEKFKPGFHNTNCWFPQPLNFVIYTMTPGGILILINLFLFLITTKRISKTMKLSNYIKTSKEKSERAIFMKLFIMIGLNWILWFIHGLVSFLTGIEVLFYIFIIMAGLDGIWVFIVTVCTKRVWNELRHSITTRKTGEQNRATNTPKAPTGHNNSNSSDKIDKTTLTDTNISCTHL